ncbi:protein DDI1 homolog 2-like isoform X1 [Tachypleus tridentatus]|uniref:protein DDI1 homolog 2-like isoform X1 n=1 Tax=Tachypleus tridentatus TaxID=6853 RepID=UPI003FD5DC94
MKVTVTTLGDDIFTLDVSDDMELVNFKALCEYESGVPATEIVVTFEGRPLLDDRQPLKGYGVKEGDVLLIQQIVHQRQSGNPQQASGLTFPNIDFGNIHIPPVGQNQRTLDTENQNDPAHIREVLLNSPEQLALLKHNNPHLADALLSGSVEQFTSVLQEQQEQRARKEQLRIRMMNADPFDAEAQQLIAEEIKQQNIDSNMEAAMEYHPESFGQVVMLYINCKVNGHPVRAFIDSGAQTTIMSQACAERCSIIRLVDGRWAGVAKGVGTQKIIGRIHLVQIQIENDFLTSSFSVLEDQPMDMLLGLDMLKRHQCCIDLKRNKLVIGTTGTETRFLSESELPECARLQLPQIPMPGSILQEQEDQQLAQALANSAREGFKVSGSSNQDHPSTSITSAQPMNDFPEENIQKLIQLGFSRENVLKALQRFNGDVDQAMAALFAMSLKLP